MISHGIIMRYLCLSFQRRTAPGGLLCAAEKMTGSHPSDFHSDEISPEMLPGMMVFRKDFIMAEKKKVVVAMSGGVDSTLTARLLLDQGYEVYGATMYQFDGQDEEIEGARKMAEFIGVPFKVIDVREAYQKFVLNYFIESYAAGMTPNPCMMCDFKVKFGLFYDEVRKAFDAPYFATGHYARIVYNPETELFEVRKGLDIAKDQSYMMYHLTQEQLSHIIFPLGRTFKKDTRLISKEKGLPTYNKAESQDICFLTSEKSYVEFLENHAPEAFQPGNIVDKKGHVLGQHKGIPYYTIGQRKGLGIAARTPLYVIELRPDTREVVVGSNEDLFRTRLLANELHFYDDKIPQEEFRCQAKIRYGVRVHDCSVKVGDDGRAVVTFDEPQRAVTTGQSVVFYDGDLLLGGGTIVRAL